MLQTERKAAGLLKVDVAQDAAGNVRGRALHRRAALPLLRPAARPPAPPPPGGSPLFHFRGTGTAMQCLPLTILLPRWSEGVTSVLGKARPSCSPSPFQNILSFSAEGKSPSIMTRQRGERGNNRRQSPLPFAPPHTACGVCVRDAMRCAPERAKRGPCLDNCFCAALSPRGTRRRGAASGRGPFAPAVLF